MTFLLNTYWWLGSLPMKAAKNFFSICEYFLSTTRSAPLVDVTGWPCCNIKKPYPSLDAPPWPSVGPLSLKYLSSWWSLILWKASFHSWVQIRSHSCVSGGCVALTFLKGFVGIWKGTALAIIKSSLLIHLLAAPSWLLHPVSADLPSIYSSSSQVQWMVLCFIWIWTSPFSGWGILLHSGLAL